MLDDDAQVETNQDRDPSNEIIRLLAGLLTDRAENVRFGSIDALW